MMPPVYLQMDNNGLRIKDPRLFKAQILVCGQSYRSCEDIEFLLIKSILCCIIKRKGQDGTRKYVKKSKTRGGGLCVYVNEDWCTNCGLVNSYCSEAIELMTVKYRPHYPPWEFTAMFVTNVYIPVGANEAQ